MSEITHLKTGARRRARQAGHVTGLLKTLGRHEPEERQAKGPRIHACAKR
jgi:hypothetical protein